jgi:hypothetical protein
MGIKITVMDARNMNSQSNSMMMLVSEAKPSGKIELRQCFCIFNLLPGGSEEVADHSTRFAKSLGFYEDAPWSLSNPQSIKDVEEAMNVDDLASQDKRQYLEDSGRLSYLGDDD